MHAAPVRLHGATATRQQAIVTGSGMGRLCFVWHAPHRYATTLLCGHISSYRHVRGEFTLRQCWGSRASIMASPLMLLGRGCLDMDAVMVDDRKSI
jgi:hypothetical protein